MSVPSDERMPESEDLGSGECRFCGDADEENGVPTGSGTCGSCYDDMRACPVIWVARLKATGHEVHFVGELLVIITERHEVLMIRRDPYAPGPADDGVMSCATDEEELG